MFRKIIIILIFAVAVLPMFSFADQAAPNDYIYLFHLYYDNGKLVADRDFQYKYDVIPEKFVAENLTTQFPYKGEVINLKDRVVATFEFDPRQGNPNFLKGKISVKAPYASDGKQVNFYDNQDKPLTTIFVNESSFCNDDGICNADVGEDSSSCPNDCKIAASLTPTPTPEQNKKSSGLLSGIIWSVLGVLIIAGWFIWKWWRKKKENSIINPT